LHFVAHVNIEDIRQVLAEQHPVWLALQGIHGTGSGHPDEVGIAER
jgi:hypothetical protein